MELAEPLAHSPQQFDQRTRNFWPWARFLIKQHVSDTVSSFAMLKTVEWAIYECINNATIAKTTQVVIIKSFITVVMTNNVMQQMRISSESGRGEGKS